MAVSRFLAVSKSPLLVAALQMSTRKEIEYAGSVASVLPSTCPPHRPVHFQAGEHISLIATIELGQ